MCNNLLGVLCVAFVLSIGWPALAQSSDAVCSEDFLWANNDKNQDPCTIGAWLLSPCLADPNNAVVTKLADNLGQNSGTYGTPTHPDQCGCSMVYYNIIQACGACQGGNITSWSNYQGDECVASLVSIAKYPYPIPDGTDVPAWAYIDISGTNAFNIDVAKSFAVKNNTMFSATPSASSLSASSSLFLASSTTSMTSASSTSPTTPATSSSPDQEPSIVPQAANKSRDGAIAGGAVGGVAGVVVVAAALAFWLRGRAQRVRRRYSSCTIDPSVVGRAPRTTSPSLQPSDSASKVYDPYQPSAYPGIAQIHSLTYDDRNAAIVSAGDVRPMGYTGAAET